MPKLRRCGAGWAGHWAGAAAANSRLGRAAPPPPKSSPGLAKYLGGGAVGKKLTCQDAQQSFLELLGSWALNPGPGTASSELQLKMQRDTFLILKSGKMFCVAAVNFMTLN